MKAPYENAIWAKPRDANVFTDDEKETDYWADISHTAASDVVSAISTRPPPTRRLFGLPLQYGLNLTKGQLAAIDPGFKKGKLFTHVFDARLPGGESPHVVNRRASPLIFHIHRDGDSYVAVALEVPSRFLPAAARHGCSKGGTFTQSLAVSEVFNSTGEGDLANLDDLRGFAEHFNGGSATWHPQGPVPENFAYTEGKNMKVLYDGALASP